MIEKKLRELQDLPRGWDGRRARPVTDAAVQTTRRVLRELMPDPSVLPQLFPLPDGGIQSEWHFAGDCVEVEVDADGEAHLLVTTLSGDVLHEGLVRLDEGGDEKVGLVRDFLHKMSERLDRAAQQALDRSL